MPIDYPQLPARSQQISWMEEFLHPHEAEFPSPAVEAPLEGELPENWSARLHNHLAATGMGYPTKVTANWKSFLLPGQQIICALTAIDVAARFMPWAEDHIPPQMETWPDIWYEAYAEIRAMIDAGELDKTRLRQFQESLFDFTFAEDSLMWWEGTSEDGFSARFFLPNETDLIETVVTGQDLPPERIRAILYFQKLTGAVLSLMTVILNDREAPIASVRTAMEAYIIAKHYQLEPAMYWGLPDYMVNPRIVWDLEAGQRLAVEFYEQWQRRCKSALAFAGDPEIWQ